jgi:hypothetical protein
VVKEKKMIVHLTIIHISYYQKAKNYVIKM